MIKNDHIAVVILNWNGKHYLEQFLPSVIQHSPLTVEIIVGDNGSTDDSVDFLKNTYPRVRVIENGSNLGFAGGYNQVLKDVAADYYILLNSDVAVTPNWIDPVIDLLKSNEQIAAAQPKVRSYQHRDAFEHAGAAGGYLDVLGYPFCAGRILDVTETDDGQFEQYREIFWASGAALFIKKEAWDRIGGFDADFFAHMEEIDLCWRLKTAGYQIWYCPSSTVYHMGGGTLHKENPFKTYLNFRNNLWMLQKNLPFWSAVVLIFVRLWLDLLALIHFLIDGKPKEARAVNKAHLSFFRNFFKTMRKRKAFSALSSLTAVYKGSIIWNYYVKGIKTFTALNSKTKD